MAKVTKINARARAQELGNPVLIQEAVDAFFGERPEPIDPRSVRVRFSALKQMAISPLHYRDAVQLDRDDESVALRLGSGAHAMLFDKPWTVWTGKVRSGGVWDEFERQHAGSVILNLKEYGEASRMVDAIRQHKDAMALLQGTTFERELHFDHELQGRACRVTPDAFNAERVVELKTTRSAEPSRFSRDGRWRSYHGQLAWQQDGVRLSGLGRPAEAYIIAVESTRPHPVTVLRLTDNALDEGRRVCRLWLERLIVCEAFDHWPAYVESIVDFDVDDAGELSLQIGGEEVEL